MNVPVDWKPERAVQTKIRDFQEKQKQKKQSYDCWNTLMGEYTAPVQKGDFFQDFKSRVDFLPSESISYYFAPSLPYQMAWPNPQECHIQWRLPSVVLRYHSPLQTYMFCLVYTIVQVAFIHSYIHASTSILSCIHTFIRTPAYAQHQATHGCINRPESVPASSLQLGPRSFQVTSSNKRTTWALSKVSSPVSLVKRCHRSIMFQAACSNKRTAWTPFQVSSPVSLVKRCHLSCLKWQVQTNEQLETFPQWVWSRDVTNQSCLTWQVQTNEQLETFP